MSRTGLIGDDLMAVLTERWLEGVVSARIASELGLDMTDVQPVILRLRRAGGWCSGLVHGTCAVCQQPFVARKRRGFRHLCTRPECAAHVLREQRRRAWARSYAAHVARTGMGYREARQAADPEIKRREQERARSGNAARRATEQAETRGSARRRHQRWNAHEDDLVLHPDGQTIVEVAQALGRTAEGVRKRRKLLNKRMK